MSDLAQLSDRQRAGVRALAAAVLESVRADAKMPLPFRTTLTLTTAIPTVELCRRPDVEDFVTQMSQEIAALAEERDKATERLMFCLRIYKGYRIESRGPAGCIFDAIAALRPDVALDLGEMDAHDVYAKHWPEDTCTEMENV